MAVYRGRSTWSLGPRVSACSWPVDRRSISIERKSRRRSPAWCWLKKSTGHPLTSCSACRSMRPIPTKTLCLCLRREDRTIVPSTECRRVLDVRRGSYRINTKRAAHFLSVSKAKWLSPSSIQVQAENYHHGRWAIFWTVRLELSGGTWRITDSHEDGEA